MLPLRTHATPPSVALVVALLVAGVAGAQPTPTTGAATPEPVRLRVGGTAERPTVTREDGPIDKGITFDPARGARLVVTCEAAVPCTALAAVVQETGAPLGVEGATAGAATVQLPSAPGSARASVRLRVAGRDASPVVLLVAATGAPVDDDAASPAGGAGTGIRTARPSALDLASVRCPLFPEADAGDADLVLDGRGNVLRAPTRTLHEGHVVTVAVYADRRLLDQLRVVRASPTRPLVVSRILGEGTTAESLRLQSVERAECTTMRYQLGDFAPGTGKIDVQALGSGAVTTLASHEFKVNALYTGALSLGVVRTTLDDPTYTKVFTGRDTVVGRSSAGAGRVLYVLTYTPYVWGARDVTVAPSQFVRRLNPFLGVGLNDVARNAFVGVSLELAARFTLNYGLHAGRVTVLDPASGAQVGAPFANRGATVPTVSRWGFKPFYGVSVDVLAAVQLLKAAVK